MEDMDSKGEHTILKYNANMDKRIMKKKEIFQIKKIF